VDAQVKGPYRFWCHEHIFESLGHQTLMRDLVEYELPFGLLGRVGFEPTTPGSKVTRSAAERRTTAADSNSAVLTAWIDRFLVESGAQL